MNNRVPLVRKSPAYPKLMRKIGVFPKLWEAEKRAVAYSDEVRQRIVSDRCREARKKRETAE
jgi:hypothetical protein